MKSVGISVASRCFVIQMFDLVWGKFEHWQSTTTTWRCSVNDIVTSERSTCCTSWIANGLSRLCSLHDDYHKICEKKCELWIVEFDFEQRHCFWDNCDAVNSKIFVNWCAHCAHHTYVVSFWLGCHNATQLYVHRCCLVWCWILAQFAIHSVSNSVVKWGCFVRQQIRTATLSTQKGLIQKS